MDEFAGWIHLQCGTHATVPVNDGRHQLTCRCGATRDIPAPSQPLWTTHYAYGRAS